MKLIKQASGKTTIKMSKKEWTDLGKRAGWMKEAFVQGEEANRIGSQMFSVVHDYNSSGGAGRVTEDFNRNDLAPETLTHVVDILKNLLNVGAFESNTATKTRVNVHNMAGIPACARSGANALAALQKGDQATYQSEMQRFNQYSQSADDEVKSIVQILNNSDLNISPQHF
jgi:hypothetical protein